jgi:hypothetical protein
MSTMPRASHENAARIARTVRRGCRLFGAAQIDSQRHEVLARALASERYLGGRGSIARAHRGFTAFVDLHHRLHRPRGI